MKLRWKIAMGGAVLLGLAAILLVAAHSRAKAALEAYKRQFRMQGEKLTTEELIPPAPTNGPNGAAALMSAASRLPSFDYSNQPALMKTVSPGRARVAWMQPRLASTDSTNVWPGLKADIDMSGAALEELRSALEMPVLHFDLNYRAGFDLTLQYENHRLG